MANNNSWKKIFDDYKILENDFSKQPFYLSAKDIKKSVQDFKNTSEKEVRILCKMDTRESVPEIMKKNGLILLPVKNKFYVIVKGEGYVDIPDIEGDAEIYNTKLDFDLDTTKIGNSEMQHLDFAYASSLIRTFMEDPSLVLTIRGRKYTPEFTYKVGNNTVEAKNSSTKNTIIRQLYYPYRQWSEHTKKKVFLLFFEKRVDEYLVWQYEFTDKNSYDSIKLVKSKKYKII